FAIGVAFTTAASVPPGDVTLPAHLRYQACNETTCFPPKTVDVNWTLTVIQASQPPPITVGHDDVLKRIAFGHGEAPRLTNDPTGSAAPSGGVKPATDLNPGAVTRLDD